MPAEQPLYRGKGDLGQEKRRDKQRNAIGARGSATLTPVRLLLAASWWDQHAGALGLAGLIITTIGLAAGVIFFLLQREKKTFDWQLLTDEPIVTSAARDAIGGIKVFWGDQTELQHPRLVTVRLVNTGKREIRAEDFDGDVRLTVDPTLVIRSAGAVRRKEGMRHTPECAYVAGICNLSAILYNRSDWVDVQLLLDSNPEADEGVPEAILSLPWAEALAAFHEFRRHEPISVDSVIAGQTRRGRKI